MNKWISVKEKEPETTGVYLVNIHQEDEESGKYGDLVIEAFYQKTSLLLAPEKIGWTLLNEWHEHTATMREYISHRIPLPEPPFKQDIVDEQSFEPYEL